MVAQPAASAMARTSIYPRSSPIRRSTGVSSALPPPRRVHVPNGRGEDLRLPLGRTASGRRSARRPDAYERLEVEGDVGTDALQAIVDQWER